MMLSKLECQNQINENNYSNCLVLHVPQAQSQADDQVSTRVDCIFIILFDPGHGLLTILRYVISGIEHNFSEHDPAHCQNNQLSKYRK